MTEDERIVREAVIDPVIEKNVGNGWIRYWVTYGKVSIFGSDGNGFDSAAEAWSAARAFIEERLEQIRLVEEEIATLNSIYLQLHLGQSQWPTFERILAREQAVLAELKRGMR